MHARRYAARTQYCSTSPLRSPVHTSDAIVSRVSSARISTPAQWTEIVASARSASFLARNLRERTRGEAAAGGGHAGF